MEGGRRNVSEMKARAAAYRKIEDTGNGYR